MAGSSCLRNSIFHRKTPFSFVRIEFNRIFAEESTPAEEAKSEEVASEVVAEPWESLQVGDKVVHKSFGPGEVMSIDEKFIIVRFSDMEKKFLFPDAFEKGYLSC